MKSLFNINDNDNLTLYFSLKNKKGLSLSNEDYSKYVDIFSNYLLDNFVDYDLLVIPESSSNLLKDIIKKSKIKNYIELKKNDKRYIREQVQKFEVPKIIKQSQYDRIDKMEFFQINKIKSNQRFRYVPFLFQQINVKNYKKILILDDSYFTGNTIEAMKFVLPKSDVIVLFDNNV